MNTELKTDAKTYTRMALRARLRTQWRRKLAAAAVLVSAATLAVVADAQEPVPGTAGEDAQAVPTVVTTGVRDPAMAPYADVYNTLARVRKASGGKVDLVFRIVSAKSTQPIADLVIALQGSTTSEKLALAPDGVLTIPFDEKYALDKAEFVSNKKAGTLRAEYYLVPVLPKERLSYGDIAASIAAGRLAIKEMVPWYMRMFGGKIHGVKICYPDAGKVVVIADNTVPPRLASDEQKFMVNKRQVYCAAFDDAETQAKPETALAPVAGWIAQYY